MLNEKGFDQWAEDYEQSVALSDADDRYPFAGYRDILDTICRNVLSQGAKDVLDIGFGTGTLSAALYAQGCRIYGQDFSAQMLRRLLTGAVHTTDTAHLRCHRCHLLAASPDGPAKSGFYPQPSFPAAGGRLPLYR